ncbi:hypothetical protein AOLI_G00079230 [Acnodon oligacanthus]
MKGPEEEVEKFITRAFPENRAAVGGMAELMKVCTLWSVSPAGIDLNAIILIETFNTDGSSDGIGFVKTQPQTKSGE